MQEVRPVFGEKWQKAFITGNLGIICDAVHQSVSLWVVCVCESVWGCGAVVLVGGWIAWKTIFHTSRIHVKHSSPNVQGNAYGLIGA
jgi:hypothetical protein